MALELFKPRGMSGNRRDVPLDGAAAMAGPTQQALEWTVESRRALSRLLTRVVDVLSRARGSRHRRTLLEGEIRRALDAPSVKIRDGALHEAPDGLRVDDGTVRVAMPGARNPPLHLAIATRRDGGIDGWGRQHLLDVARISALALGDLPDGVGGRDNTCPPTPHDSPQLIGASEAMTRLRHEISRMAATAFTVLIEGESGSGKELVARRIHDESARSDGRFVGVNCAALVETLLEAELFGIEDRTATGVRGRRGKFELADGGTLFMDEVSDLSPAAQAKLLRAIQEMSVERVGGHTTRRLDIRIIVATNQSLRGLVAAGNFRADLYYRLGGLEIQVPPLRERPGDIPLLTNHFLERYRDVREVRLSRLAIDALLTYDWPGNVRELERVVERSIAMASSSEIAPEDLPPFVRDGYDAVLAPSLDRDDTMRAWGSRYARIVLDRCNQNKRQACQMLGISYHTLQSYLAYESPASKE